VLLILPVDGGLKTDFIGFKRGSGEIIRYDHGRHTLISSSFEGYRDRKRGVGGTQLGGCTGALGSVIAKKSQEYNVGECFMAQLHSFTRSVGQKVGVCQSDK